MSDASETRFPADAVMLPGPEGPSEGARGDFEVPRTTVLITALAIPLGALVALVALGLLDLIALFTHLAYTGVASTRLEPPDTSKLGVLSALVPVAGGLIVGMMARVGSERIRGHGIPEAMETIMLKGSRMEPRLAVLKPLSSAISIGSGGPFGAEGPIIVTGGAVGSIISQFLHLSGSERRALLVAGAAAGMTAVFGTPIAAVLLAVELLLFEWRPRSMVPVAAAAASAAVCRQALASAGLLTAAPLFHIASHGALPLQADAGALLIGLCGGLLALLMTRCVYGAEDLFGRLPLHWMWWPAIGGAVVGCGGLIDPRVLGVGYATIDAELAGKVAIATLLLLLVLKLAVWSIALGSNTSGGILAPVLMIGAAAGGIVGSVLSGAGDGTWAMIGMAAALAGVTRSPLTSIVFALELTGDVSALPELLIACTLAHITSVMLLRRSILTEKVARRGFHVTRDYEIDALQALLAGEVMQTDLFTVPADASAAAVMEELPEGHSRRRQRLYPLIGADGLMTGVVSFRDLLAARDCAGPAGSLAREPLVAFPDETLRQVADRMLASGHSVLPVVERGAPGALRGLIGHGELLRAHERVLIEERARERPLLPNGLSGTLGGLVPSRRRA